MIVLWRKLLNLLFAERHNGQVFRTGLLPHVPDERDMEFGWFFGLMDYKPKHERLELKTLDIKNQAPFNTCGMHSAITQKEIEEGKPLSVRFQVAAMRKAGKVSGNGFSNLRENQEILRSIGACEDEMVPDGIREFYAYSNAAVLSYDRQQNAGKHKNARYFSVKSESDWLKALDDGHAVHTGMTWRTGYNMGGGLAPPWILQIGKGQVVGGHAITAIGYDTLKGLLIFQNSFGDKWGDNGKFYIRLDTWFKMGNVGYVGVDVEDDIIIDGYEGRQVKGSGPTIYLIQDGKKRAFPNADVFFTHGGKFDPERTWQLVPDSVLNAIPEGVLMV